MSKRVMRPRLERTQKSRVSGAIVDDVTGGEPQFIEVIDAGYLRLANAKRLHKFLGRAIAYLESKAGK